ncbi:hypothetical protein PUN28_000974 [Cardiocondyla obscurior]|uniref:Uncharacterized protein n=1 Tax=Cardiocondyla obscurior TaxID=286306 RepID=A0AAW2H297_9HYME
MIRFESTSRTKRRRLSRWVARGRVAGRDRKDGGCKGREEEERRDPLESNKPTEVEVTLKLLHG